MNAHEQEILERNSMIVKLLIESIRQYTSTSLGQQTVDLDLQERNRRMLLRLARKIDLLLSTSYETVPKGSEDDGVSQSITGSDALYAQMVKEVRTYTSKVIRLTDKAGKSDSPQQTPLEKFDPDQIMSELRQIMHRWIVLLAPDLAKKLQGIARLHLDPNPKRGEKAKLWLSAAEELEKLNVPKRDISKTLKLLMYVPFRDYSVKEPMMFYSFSTMHDEASSRQRSKETARPFNSGYFSRIMAKAGYVDQERQERRHNKRPHPDKDRPDARLRFNLRMRLIRIYDRLKELESDDSAGSKEEILYMRQLARALRLRMTMIDRRRSRVPYLDHIRMMNRSEAGGSDSESWSRYITWSSLQDRFIEDPSRLSKLRQLPIFEPDCRDEAIVCGYYGMQCPECEGWRVVKAHDHKVQCTVCQHTFKAQISTRCRYCDRPIVKDEAECANGLLCPSCGTLTEISVSGDYVLRFTDRQLRQDKTGRVITAVK